MVVRDGSAAEDFVNRVEPADSKTVSGEVVPLNLKLAIHGIFQRNLKAQRITYLERPLQLITISGNSVKKKGWDLISSIPKQQSSTPHSMQPICFEHMMWVLFVIM